MTTVIKNANAAPGAAAKANEATTKIANRPSLTGKEAKQDEPKDQKPAQTASVEPGKAPEVTTGDRPAVDHQPADPAPAAIEQAVDGKPEGKQAETAGVKAEPKKFALNLEQTLKSVEGLHRLSIQRITLLSRIKLLEDFEVKLIEENDELESNPYQGCKLIIQDDKRREFVTNTPNLIRMVAQFIFDACHDKLAEIEANIVFPNA